MWRSPLLRKYAAVLMLLSAATIAGYGGADLIATRREARQQAEQALQGHAREAAHALRVSLAAVRRSIEAVTDLPLDDAWLGLGVRREEYARLLRLVPAVDRISHVDGAGVERLAMSRRGLVQWPARDQAASGASGTAPAQPPAVHRVHFADTLQPVLQLAFAEGPARGGGSTRLQLSLLVWARELATLLEAPDTSVYFVDEVGALAVHAQAAQVLARKSLGPATAASSPLVDVARGLGGATVLRVIEPLGEMGWQVVAERDWQAVSAPVSAALWRSVGAMAVGLLLAFVAALVLAGRLSRPVRALHGAATRLAQGDLSARVQIRTGDELEDLAGQFNAMAERLRENVTHLETQVAARTAELERANRHKDEFLAHMSHELRTPLNAVLGFADVLREGMAGPLNADQQEFVAHIHASGQHLLALINDVLNLSKIEAGQLELQLADFDLVEVLASAADLVRQRALRGSIDLQLQLDAAPALWHGDARRIKQVVLNLLGNAVKFTPPGGSVTLTAALQDDRLRVTVQDTGVGIAGDDQQRIFDEFVQVGAHLGRQVAGQSEGTGLGLPLARRLARQHGGEVTVDSQPGVGATFTLTLPRLAPDATPLPAESPGQPTAPPTSESPNDRQQPTR